MFSGDDLEIGNCRASVSDALWGFAETPYKLPQGLIEVLDQIVRVFEANG
jgi:hypothetical protein